MIRASGKGAMIVRPHGHGRWSWIRPALAGDGRVHRLLPGPDRPRAYPGSGADLVDWKPTRSHEVEAQLEVDDVQQMIEAQNEYRRRRGAAELTEDDASDGARGRGDPRASARSHEAALGELEDEFGV